MKRRYLITYDLNSPGQDYQKLYRTIESVSDGACVRVCESAFLIRSVLQTAHEVLVKITPAFDINDVVLVTEVDQTLQAYLPNEEHSILVQNLMNREY